MDKGFALSMLKWGRVAFLTTPEGYIIDLVRNGNEWHLPPPPPATRAYLAPLSGQKPERVIYTAEEQAVRREMTWRLWHGILKHTSACVMHRMGQIHPEVPAFSAEVEYRCEHCLLFNINQRPTKQKVNKHVPATRAYGRVFVDIAGPFMSPTTGGAFYFIAFIDEKTKTGKTYLLRRKAAAFKAFQDFLTFIGKTPEEVCILHTDNAIEFGSGRMTELLRTLSCRR